MILSCAGMALKKISRPSQRFLCPNRSNRNAPYMVLARRCCHIDPNKSLPKYVAIEPSGRTPSFPYRFSCGEERKRARGAEKIVNKIRPARHPEIIDGQDQALFTATATATGGRNGHT